MIAEDVIASSWRGCYRWQIVRGKAFPDEELKQRVLVDIEQPLSDDRLSDWTVDIKAWPKWTLTDPYGHLRMEGEYKEDGVGVSSAPQRIEDSYLNPMTGHGFYSGGPGRDIPPVKD